MTGRWDQIEVQRDRVAREMGPPFAAGDPRVAMLYPSPYRVAMSSLGYQQVLGLLRDGGVAAERVCLPDDVAAWRATRRPPLSLETETPLSHFPLIAVSLAYEMELAGLIEVLELAGISPLRADRGPGDPRVLLGGPLTFSNPLPAAPFVDAMLLGEAEDTALPAVMASFEATTRDGWLDAVHGLPGGYVPERDGARLPPLARASDARLPALSRIRSPDTELADMFLVEAERGCHRTCSFCVMRRSTNGGMRLVGPDRLLDLVPPDAPKVGLVGAAVSDHPKLVDLLRTLVDSGRGVGVSSLRADRVARRPDIAALLRRSGARTLTVASDAATEALRKAISKGTREEHLVECARQAGALGYEAFKVYMMLGLPGETDEDVEELIRFTLELARHARVALGVAPFVAKRNTPLDGTPFGGIKTVERRMKRLTRGLRGRAEVRPTSARWAWAEYQLAQGGPEAGLAVLDAVHAGGRFAHYKRAFAQVDPASHRPWVAHDLAASR